MPDSIAHYRIGNKLGQGAMGEVYRATDTKLGRDVAIKMIAPALAGDPSRMASFIREAQVLASLNHPNIAAIYGVEDHALVMELVEGPTLADRIKQGPIPMNDALAIARQIGDGLAAAHDRGIVHRDLKPANIKITPDGTVKLLDFGLARAAASAATAADDAATIAYSIAGAEMIAGTPAYMAPEQARGLPLDKRADIWAFGVVLYEMLTGTPLYTGATATDIMAAVVREEPDLSRVPASVRPVLRRCLEKDPKRRLRDVGDAVLLLETVREAPRADASPRGLRAWIPWAAAAVAVAAFAGVLTVHLRETPAAANTVRFRLTVPPDITFTQTTQFAVSPDGRTLAFPAYGPAGDNRVWVQEFDRLEPRVLQATSIAVVPDFLGWYDNDTILYTGGRKLKVADIDGAPPSDLFDYVPPLLGVAVGQDGSIVYGSATGVMRWTPGGGEPTPLTRIDPKASPPRLHAVADLLPDGRHFLYTISGEAGTRSIFAGRIDAAPEDQIAEPILKTDFGAVFVPDPGSSSTGHLLIVRDTSILAQPFDAGSLRPVGEAVPVAQDVFVANNAGFGIAFYSASRQGTLVYRTGTLAENLSRQLSWVGRDGAPLGTLSELGRINQVKLSPDGTRAVTSRTELETANTDLWITDLAVETSTKFTFGGANVQPVWSPDSRYIAWARIREKDIVFYRRSSDGAGGEELLYTLPERRNLNVSDWSDDARFLIYAYGGDVFALPVGTDSDENRQPIPLAATMASEFGGTVSPNGRWLAYVSNETKRQEVYVQPFHPGAQASGQATPVAGKFMVSSGTLGLVRWRSDSGELIFLNSEGALVSVDVSATPVFKASAPRVLAQLPRGFLVQAGNPGALADTTKDLKRLLLAVPSEAGRRQELSVVLNWPDAPR